MESTSPGGKLIADCEPLFSDDADLDVDSLEACLKKNTINFTLDGIKVARGFHFGGGYVFTASHVFSTCFSLDYLGCSFLDGTLLAESRPGMRFGGGCFLPNEPSLNDNDVGFMKLGKWNEHAAVQGLEYSDEEKTKDEKEHALWADSGLAVASSSIPQRRNFNNLRGYYLGDDGSLKFVTLLFSQKGNGYTIYEAAVALLKGMSGTPVLIRFNTQRDSPSYVLAGFFFHSSGGKSFILDCLPFFQDVVQVNATVINEIITCYHKGQGLERVFRDVIVKDTKSSKIFVRVPTVFQSIAGHVALHYDLPDSAVRISFRTGIGTPNQQFTAACFWVEYQLQHVYDTSRVSEGNAYDYNDDPDLPGFTFRFPVVENLDRRYQKHVGEKNFLSLHLHTRVEKNFIRLTQFNFRHAIENRREEEEGSGYPGFYDRKPVPKECPLISHLMKSVWNAMKNGNLFQDRLKQLTLTKLPPWSFVE